MHVSKKVSINHFPESVIVCNFLYGNPLGGYTNLSSKRYKSCLDGIRKEELECNQLTRIDEKIEYESFEYKNESTGLRMIHRINLLCSIENQDLIRWRIAFQELSRICKWSEKQRQ
ncbi:hypothetical protein DMUE_1944 [Dictyocoela muelleri]|nr:hypothetical protein DMUE_1944 [Dictyocoela muelleri]